MRDDDHGHLLLGQLPDDLQHLAGQLRVEGRGGFVEEQDLRLHRKGARDCDPLLLSARELAGIACGLVRDAHFAKQLHRPRFGLLAAAAKHLYRRVGQVFQHAVVREEVKLLKHQAAAAAKRAQLARRHIDGPSPRLGAGGAFAHIADLAAVDRLQKSRTAQQRRLAGAGGPDDADDLAAVDAETDALQDLVVRKGFADIPHGKYVHAAPLHR